MDDRSEFANREDELHYNLVQAEKHARRAHNMLFERGGPKRSFWFRSAAGRAQSILMTLANLELKRKGKSESVSSVGE